MSGHGPIWMDYNGVSCKQSCLQNSRQDDGLDVCTNDLWPDKMLRFDIALNCPKCYYTVLDEWMDSMDYQDWNYDV